MTRLCAVFVCTNTTGIRFRMWLTDSGSMIDTTECRESRLKDKTPSKSDHSACMPNK